MKINNMCLKKVCFGMYLNRFIRFSQETLEFLPDIAYQYLTEQEWITLSKGLPELKNLELNDPVNKRYWESYIKKNARKITDFTLSNIDQTEDSKYTPINKLNDFTPLVKALTSCKNINFLRLEQALFNENQLIRVIQNNPKIQTFISNECSNMSSKSVQAVADFCPHIEEIILMMNDKFTAESMINMTSLQTLAIRNLCLIQEAVGESKKQSLSKLSKNLHKLKVYRLVNQLLIQIITRSG